MNKILEINEKPFLHGYSHTASFMSIVMGKVRFNQSDVSVSGLTWCYSDLDKKDFLSEIEEDNDKKKILKQLPPNVEKTDDILDMHFGKRNDIKSDSCYLFNTMEGLTGFEFKLNSMKEVCRWSMAGAEINEEGSNAHKNVFRAVFSPMNVIRIMGEKYGNGFSIEIKNNDECKYMKINISDKIEVLISTDGHMWKNIYSCENYFADSARIGFFAWIGNDSFQDWFYSNYIQLHCSNDLECCHDVKLNYYIPAFLNYRYNMSNPWLEQHYIPRDYIDSSNGILDFVRFCLKRNKYLTLHLNEKYVPDKWAYSITDFEHESLIYGIDDEKKQLHLMGFNKNQKFEPYALSYNDFSLAYKNVFCNKDLVMLSYKIPDLACTLDIKRIVTFLNEYLLGTNSTYRETLMYDEMNWVFGIKVYDVMINNVKKLRDKKIPYLISEHKKIMKERVRYLYNCNILTKVDFEELFEMATNVEELSQVLLMLCIKFKMTSKEKYEEKIATHILKLKEADKIFVERLIETLV